MVTRRITIMRDDVARRDADEKGQFSAIARALRDCERRRLNGECVAIVTDDDTGEIMVGPIPRELLVKCGN